MATELVSIDSERTLSIEQYQALADVPPELEWLANITNEKTRRAYKVDVAEFLVFSGLTEINSLRSVARAHVIAWRKDMERRGLASTSVRRKLSALSSLFDYLCERNAVLGNPVDGVKRPASNNNEGSTPALGDAQARRLLEAPPLDTLKGIRDRAILATLLYHGIRREELCRLRLKDIQSREGRHALPHSGKARQDPVRADPSGGVAAHWRVPAGGEARRGGRSIRTLRRRFSGPWSTIGRGSSIGTLIRGPSTATS